MSTDTRRRVKLYALNADRQWDDRGTGHVSSQYVERLKGQSLLVRAEADGSLLLESKIAHDTAYQKQQETLIVWSEGDNYDLALSFQEKIGCDEIWAKICLVQGKDPSVDITQDVDDDCFDDTIELPACELSRLDDIADVIASALPFPLKREKLALALESDAYIRKLLALFRDCEKNARTRELHKLFEMFKNIFLLNKNPLFEVLLGEESLWDVIGVLEYDPNNPQKHREYLKNVSTFKQIIPFSNTELINKIHQTYRVQYIQDIILPQPSVFEENILSTLSSFIFFNKVEIVSLIQDDDKFLTSLFSQLTNEKSEKRRDLALFLKELCTFSQTLQPQNRENFFKTMNGFGILKALEATLASDDVVVKCAAADILSFVVEFSPSMIREHALQHAHEEERASLVNVIITQMIVDVDPELGLATQLSGVIKLLVDPENMLAIVNKSEKTDFLNYFYKRCMHVLVAPLLNTHAELSSSQASLLSLVIELLSFCVEHHAYHVRNFVLQRDLLRRVLSLMTSKHAFLALTSLRFARKIIGLKDEFYNRHIVAGNLLEPVVDALIQNKGRYNLLDSAIVELFEYIRTEEIKSLCVHVVEKYGARLDAIEYVRTFKGLKLQYEQHCDRLKDSPSVMVRFRQRDARQLDEDEEMWFNAEDDECDDCDDAMSFKLDAEFDAFNKKVKSITFEKRDENRKGLVDYDEDSDEEEDEEKSEPIVKRARLA